METKLNLVFKDYRGESWQILLPDNREVMLLYTKKGTLRGGHFHSKLEISLVISGRVKYWKIINGREVIFEKSAGEFIVNQPGEPHLALALEDFFLIDFKVGAHIGEWKTTNYKPYRKLVDEATAKHAKP